MSLLCAIGLHRYETVDITTCFNTVNLSGVVIATHTVWYQYCTRCYKRRLKDSLKDDLGYALVHKGVEIARLDWERNKKIYKGHFNTDFQPPPKLTPRFRVIKGDKTD